jgi:DNA-binding SARP family transcriptional activator/tetratricopeptide (TPR) repeat protein
MAHSAKLSIRLLGPLEVAVDERPIRVDTRKALAIVALLAAEDRAFARDELAALFWPEADDESARGALRRTLSSLKSAVDGTGLVVDRSRVALDAAHVWVDVAEVERLARSSDPAALARAAGLARGPFLAGFAIRDSPAFDDWQAARRLQVERTVGTILDRLAEGRAAAGDVAGAAEAARRRVELDPLDEPGQRRLIELLARSGDRAGAIRQYRALVALFDRELGVAPLRETTELYEAIREDRAAPRDDRVISPGITAARGLPLVGRDAELAAIIRAVGSARPDGRLVIIEGEAGIGKTRLAEAAVGAVRASGGTVLASQGYPGEAGIAYGPIAGLLRVGLMLPGGPQRLRGLDPIALQELGRLVDLPASVAATGRPGSAGGPGSRIRLLDAIADGLTALAAGPVPGVIWIDDLHHGDGATLLATTFIARRSVGRPIALLLAWRREDLSLDGLAAASELLRVPGAEHVSLGRLDRPAIAALIKASRAETGPDQASIDDDFIDAVADDSEGLPLHIVEMLAADQPMIDVGQRGMRELVHERIGSVSETAAQVAAAAAVIGRSFDLELLRATSGRSEEETVDAVEELSRRGIIRGIGATTAGPIQYDFSHSRLRDAAIEATSQARLRLLHRRTAEALRAMASRPGRDVVGTFALIAAHEREAGRVVEAGIAHVEAADRAEVVFGNREAIDHLEAALALGHPAAVGLRVRIGRLHARLGGYPAAIAALETAAALADRSELAGIELSLGRVHRRRGDLPAAASHLDAALGDPELEPRLRVQALVERSGVAFRSDDLALAADLAREARASAERVGEPHMAGVAERLTGLVAQASGDLPSARAAFERSAAIAVDDPDPTAVIAASTALGLAMGASGEIDVATTTLAAAVLDCRRIGDRHLEAAVENHIADLLHEAGRDGEAMAHLKRAVALFAEIEIDEPDRDPGIWSLAAW